MWDTNVWFFPPTFTHEEIVKNPEKIIFEIPGCATGFPPLHQGKQIWLPPRELE